MSMEDKLPNNKRAQTHSTYIIQVHIIYCITHTHSILSTIGYKINTRVSNSKQTNKQNVEVDVALASFKRVMTDMFISPLLALFNMMLHKQ